MSSTAGAISTPLLRQAAQAVAQALLSLLIALALVMLLRRFSGAFVQPLNGFTLVVVAAAMAIVAAAVRLMLLESLTNAEPTTNSLLFALPGLSAAILLTALTLPGTPALAIALAWFLLIGSEGLSWLAVCRPELLRRVSTSRVAPNQTVSAQSVAETDVELPAGLIQQLTRIRENGRESIHAVLRAEIDPGDRQGALHVAFCPPLDAKPELTAHTLDADDADVRITQAETFGARIEVRFPAVAALKRTALVELLGTATSH
jgi:hypothetical protein